MGMNLSPNKILRLSWECNSFLSSSNHAGSFQKPVHFKPQAYSHNSIFCKNRRKMFSLPFSWLFLVHLSFLLWPRTSELLASSSHLCLLSSSDILSQLVILLASIIPPADALPQWDVPANPPPWTKLRANLLPIPHNHLLASWSPIWNALSLLSLLLF